MPNFVSFAACVAELAHGEKSCTQSLTHSAYLMAQESASALEQLITKIYVHILCTHAVYYLIFLHLIFIYS